MYKINIDNYEICLNELWFMDKSKITKQSGNIAFEEEAHIYYDVTCPEQKFISVTTLIHSFTQPFDKEFWSAYKALEKLLDKDAWAIEKKSLLNTKKFDKVLLELHDIAENDFNREQQAILDAWDEENRKSCERGTKIHAELENSFYKKGKDIDISKYQIGGKFDCVKDYINTFKITGGFKNGTGNHHSSKGTWCGTLYGYRRDRSRNRRR